MSKLTSVLCIILAIAAIMPLSATAKSDVVDFVGGIGLVASPGYNDALKDAYPDHDISGGLGWMDFELGVRFNITDKFSVMPNADFMFNYVSVEDDDSFVNTVVFPGLKARYAFTGKQSFFVDGGVNYGIVNTGGQMDTDSSGFGFEATLGYQFNFGLGLQLGYLHIPVDMENGDSYNFGGGLFRATYGY